jgi:hypothetical protein
MWESRRDFQEEWEGWKAGIWAFHAFHSSSFPTRASATARSARTPITDEKRVCRYRRIALSVSDTNYLWYLQVVP